MHPEANAAVALEARTPLKSQAVSARPGRRTGEKIALSASPPRMQPPPSHVDSLTGSRQASHTRHGLRTGSISGRSAASCTDTVRKPRENSQYGKAIKPAPITTTDTH